MKYTTRHYRALIQRMDRLREHDAQAMTTFLQRTLGRELADLRSGLAAMRQLPGTAPNTQNAIDSLALVAERACDSLRQMTYAIQPPGTDDLGLVPALERSVAEFSAIAGLPATLQVTGRVPQLTRDKRVLLHRVLQEALENIVRHARARRVEVLLEADRYAVVLRIRDDGTGITDFDRQKPEGLGLFALHERLIGSDGSLRVAGTPGKGTLIEASIPVARTDRNRATDLSLAHSSADLADPYSQVKESAR